MNFFLCVDWWLLPYCSPYETLVSVSKFKSELISSDEAAVGDVFVPRVGVRPDKQITDTHDTENTKLY